MPGEREVNISGVKLTVWQYQYIQSAVSRGYSANQIQSALSETGMGVRRQNLLTVARELRGEEKKKDTWKYTPKKFGISEEKHEIARMSLDTKYAYTVRVEVYSQLLDTTVNRWVRLTCDNRLTIRKMEEEAVNALLNAKGWDRYKEEIRKIELYRPMKRVD